MPRCAKKMHRRCVHCGRKVARAVVFKRARRMGLTLKQASKYCTAHWGMTFASEQPPHIYRTSRSILDRMVAREIYPTLPRHARIINIGTVDDI